MKRGEQRHPDPGPGPGGRTAAQRHVRRYRLQHAGVGGHRTGGQRTAGRRRERRPGGSAEGDNIVAHIFGGNDTNQVASALADSGAGGKQPDQAAAADPGPPIVLAYIGKQFAQNNATPAASAASGGGGGLGDILGSVLAGAAVEAARVTTRWATSSAACSVDSSAARSSPRSSLRRRASTSRRRRGGDRPPSRRRSAIRAGGDGRSVRAAFLE